MAACAGAVIVIVDDFWPSRAMRSGLRGKESATERMISQVGKAKVTSFSIFCGLWQGLVLALL
jgi:hypothetical protein